MQVKLISMIAASAIVLGSFGASAARGANCPESRASCHPVGERLSPPKPRGKASGAKLAPPQFDSGAQVWRAGNHIMY